MLVAFNTRVRSFPFEVYVIKYDHHLCGPTEAIIINSGLFQTLRQCRSSSKRERSMLISYDPNASLLKRKHWFSFGNISPFCT